MAWGNSEMTGLLFRAPQSPDSALESLESGQRTDGQNDRRSVRFSGAWLYLREAAREYALK